MIIVNNKIKRYDVRDMFVLASIDEKGSPEIEHLANLFSYAIKNYEKEEIKIKKL